MSENYSVRGREIYSARGKLVATLDDDGNPVMAPGMAGAHGNSVRKFLELSHAGTASAAGVQDSVSGKKTSTATAGNPPPMPPFPDDRENVTTGDQNAPPDGEKVTMYVGGNTPAVKPEGRPEAVTGKETLEEWEISTIPEDRLPPFSREFGTNTPGFAEYASKHKLTVPQVAALVKRLEKR